MPREKFKYQVFFKIKHRNGEVTTVTDPVIIKSVSIKGAEVTATKMAKQFQGIPDAVEVQMSILKVAD